jgi:hypothetical protein
MRSGYCLRAFGGWLAGCAAATVIIYAFVLIRFSAFPPGYNVPPASFALASLIYVLPIIFVVTLVLSGLPAVFVIWFSEKYRRRSALFFGGAGAAIGLLISDILVLVLSKGPPSFPPRIGWQFLVAGLVAGLTYWRVAGKHAGRIKSGDQA